MILRCENVSLSYDGNIVADNINFTVNDGDYLCILGENGSGKTTLINAVMGTKKVHGGKISYGDGVGAGKIGYLPQKESSNADFPASVKEIVRTGFCGKRGFRFFYSAKEKERADMLMKKLSLEEFSKRSFSELSGGQQKRVLLARALCSAEKLLVMDEPAASLDPVVTEELYAMTKELNEKDGITVIMVSHDVMSAKKYASHILHIKHEQLFFGTTADYMETELAHSYLGGHFDDVDQ